MAQNPADARPQGTAYTIRDVERILRVKPHVIRYWESELPLIQPRKDHNGRKRYSGRDLQLFLRLKYLVHDRRFTLEGAREQIYRELAGDWQDVRGHIAALKSAFLDLYFRVRREE